MKQKTLYSVAILFAFISVFSCPGISLSETYEIYRGGNLVGYEDVNISTYPGGETISSKTFFPFAINPKEISLEITYESEKLKRCIFEAKSLVMNPDDGYFESFIADDLEDCGGENYAFAYDSAIGFKKFGEIEDTPEIVIFPEEVSAMIEVVRRINLGDTDDISALITTLSPYLLCEELDIDVIEKDGEIEIDITGEETDDFFIDAKIYGEKGSDYPERVWFPNSGALYVLSDETPDIPSILFQDVPKTSKVKKVEFFGGGKTRLNGLFFMPQDGYGATSNGKFPVVVMVAGIGPHRWSYMGIYAELAKRLSEIGVASFVWDKHGCGDSGGSYYDRTPDLLLSDIGAAIEQALEITGSDPERLVLLGHSEGGFLSIITTGRDGRVKKLALLSSPGESISDIFIHDATIGAKNLPLDQKEKKEYIKAYEEMFSEIERSPKDTYLYTGCEVPQREISLGHFKGHAKLNPQDYIDDISVPVLILHGEMDFVVGDYNASLISDILKRSGNTDVTLITYPDLGHNLGDAEPEGEEKRASSIEIDHRVVNDILNWLKSQLEIEGDTHPSP